MSEINTLIFEGDNPDQLKIDSFFGDYRFLSNFYPSPMRINGVFWPTVEHAYQASKTDDVTVKQKIASLEYPGQVKRFAKQLEPKDDWVSDRIWTMTQLVRQKFKQNPELGYKLLGTQDAILIEGNNWGDRFWGQVDGKGENNLGKILMKIRNELKIM